MDNSATVVVARSAHEAEADNQTSWLPSMPEEIKLFIFEALARAVSGRTDGEYKISNMYFQQPVLRFGMQDPRSAKNFLTNYGTLCRSLRCAAVTAYYEQGLLKLISVEHASGTKIFRWNKSPLLTDKTWDRYGKLTFPVRSMSGSPLPSRDWPETPYAIELPPQYVRPLIRRIHLLLVLPDGNIHWVRDATHSAIGQSIVTTPYWDEENDWLAPVRKIYSGYGFSKMARVTVSFAFHHNKPKEITTDDMMVWVENKLRASAEIAEALDSGMIDLKWPAKSWRQLRES